MRKTVQVKLNLLLEAIPGKYYYNNELQPEKIIITDIARPEKANKNSLTFLTSTKYTNKLCRSNAKMVLIKKGIKPPETDQVFIQVENVWSTLNKLLPFFYTFKTRKPGIHVSAMVDESAQLGKDIEVCSLVVIEKNAKIGNNTYIGAQTYIGENVDIGNNVIIYPGVKLLDNTIIGNHCIIHSGAVIGADGFAYETVNNIPQKITQAGNVIVENNVEIGANTCIDKAFLDSTVIGMGTKIDNLVQIGHNCQIGAYNGMSGQVGIAGSVTTGKGVMFWGQAGIVDNISIAEHSTIGVKTLVIADIKKTHSKVFGIPSADHNQYFKMIVALKKLPTYLKTLKRMCEK